MQDYVSVNLKLHAEVHNFSEEWSGKTDPRERRKLQNRLNQRAYRKQCAWSNPLESVTKTPLQVVARLLPNLSRISSSSTSLRMIIQSILSFASMIRTLSILCRRQRRN